MHDALNEALGRVYGRRFLLAVDVVQGFRSMTAEVEALGGEVGFVLAARMGTGDLPPETLPWHSLDLPPGEDLVDAIHSADRALAEVDAGVVALVDRVDPERDMPTLGAFFSSGRPVAGRRTFGARPLAWQALEDKTVIDAVWDAAGVERAPCVVVAIEGTDLQEVSAGMDRGHGTVWAGDAREGFHGGAARTRWVRNREEAVAAERALAAHCDTVRVMPFLEGIPCSIHGVVMPDGVAVFRPAEMLVLRGPEGFFYARASTGWDPLPEGRTQMREAARRVGQHLADAYDYRGAFTMDGVMTVDGFLPTELNPRVGAAMGMLNPPDGPSVPFTLLHYALIEGQQIGVTASELEAGVLAHADAHRVARFGFSTQATREGTEHMDLCWRGEAWERCEPERADARMMAGPGPTGGFVNMRLVPGALERLGRVGPSLAPVVAAFARFADEHLHTEIGPLVPATDVQREAP